MSCAMKTEECRIPYCSPKAAEAIAGYLEELRVESAKRMLQSFSSRVPNFVAEYLYGNPKNFPLEIFEYMLGEMTIYEKRLYFYPLCDLYCHFLKKYYRRERSDIELSVQLETSFVDLLHPLKWTGLCNSHACVDLVKMSGEALEVDPEFFLGILPPNVVEYILDCFSAERFQGWNVRKSTLLMKTLFFHMEIDRNRELKFILIKYGFTYSFDKSYFQRCLFQFCDDSFKVKGQSIPDEIFFSINKIEGDLRLQMAFELLLIHFSKEYSKGIKVLARLWQSVSFSFISSAEMFSLLEPFFKNHNALLQDICEEYARSNTVFSVPRVTEPRTLQHLARVQIRKNLIETHSISDRAIDSLEIPTLLKSYLKLE